MPFKFERLTVWEMSMDLIDRIDHAIKAFPSFELYALTNQVRRAAYSISLNIVEGSTGLSNSELRRFLRIANRSAMEVVGCLHLAKRRHYLSDEEFMNLYNQTESLIIKIQAFIKSLN